MDARNLISAKRNHNRSLVSDRSSYNNRQQVCTDVRNSLPKHSSHLPHQKIPQKFDARQRIQRTIDGPKSLLEIKTEEVIVPKLSVDTDIIRTKKTIKNEYVKTAPSPDPVTASTSTVKETAGKQIKPIGFVCVTNGQRTVQNKVTIEDTGLKIAVRNDSMTKKANKAAPSPINIKKTIKGLSQAKQQYVPKMHYDAPKKELASSNSLTRKRPYTQHKPPQAEPRHMIPEKISMHRATVIKEVPMTPYEKIAKLNRESHFKSSVPQMRKPFTSYGDTSEESRLSGYEPICSPFAGTKIMIENLHPRVVVCDIQELFSAVGPVKRARMLGFGRAQVVFVRRDHAIEAIQKYNKRDLDGQPMLMQLVEQGKKQRQQWYSWMEEIGTRKQTGSASTIELRPDVLRRALFKGTAPTSARPVVFTVKV